MKGTNNTPLLGVRMQAIYDKYEESLVADNTPENTKAMYLAQTREFLAFCEKRGHQDLSKVTKRDCLDFKIELSKKINKRTGKPNVPRTQRAYLSGVNQLLKWAYEYDFMEQSFRCPYPKVNKPAPGDSLSLEEVRKVVDKAKEISHFVYLIILFLAETGRRQSELRNLLRKDIDTKKRKAWLRMTKTGRDEEISLTVPLCEAIDYHIAHTEDNEYLLYTDAVNYKGRLGENMIGRVCAEVGHDAGIGRKVKPHMFRHAYDTRGTTKSDDHTIGSQTGQTPDTIRDYVNPDEKRRRDFVDQNSVYAKEEILVPVTANGESKTEDRVSKLADLRLLLMDRRLHDKLTSEEYLTMRGDLEREELK